MKKYVDANMLQEQLQRKGYEVAKTRYNEGYNDALLKFKSMLHSAPAVDVAEVKHGKWFISEYEFFTCSNCGDSYFTGAESTAQAKSYLNSGSYYKFCPNCGAKMNGEEL